MINLGFITIAVIGWQLLILFSSITCALIWGKKGAMAALGFWVFWTVFMLFFPSLICVQLTFTFIGAGIAFPVGMVKDWLVRPKVSVSITNK
jgi:hypothetical protein